METFENFLSWATKVAVTALIGWVWWNFLFPWMVDGVPVVQYWHVLCLIVLLELVNLRFNIRFRRNDSRNE